MGLLCDKTGIYNFFFTLATKRKRRYGHVVYSQHFGTSYDIQGPKTTKGLC